jgi:hypothetical protein
MRRTLQSADSRTHETRALKEAGVRGAADTRFTTHALLHTLQSADSRTHETRALKEAVGAAGASACLRTYALKKKKRSPCRRTARGPDAEL